MYLFEMNKATPATPQRKRIVFAPNRFDPSTVTSTLHPSKSATLFKINDEKKKVTSIKPTSFNKRKASVNP